MKKEKEEEEEEKELFLGLEKLGPFPSLLSVQMMVVMKMMMMMVILSPGIFSCTFGYCTIGFGGANLSDQYTLRLSLRWNLSFYISFMTYCLQQPIVTNGVILSPRRQRDLKDSSLNI